MSVVKSQAMVIKNHLGMWFRGLRLEVGLYDLRALFQHRHLCGAEQMLCCLLAQPNQSSSEPLAVPRAGCASSNDLNVPKMIPRQLQRIHSNFSSSVLSPSNVLGPFCCFGDERSGGVICCVTAITPAATAARDIGWTPAPLYIGTHSTRAAATALTSLPLGEPGESVPTLPSPEIPLPGCVAAWLWEHLCGAERWSLERP